MKTTILLITLMIFIILGNWFMQKVDDFLEESVVMRKDSIPKGVAVIRIALDNPLVVTKLLVELKELAGKYDNLQYYFYTGNIDDLIAMLKDNDADVLVMVERPDELPKNYEVKVTEFSPIDMYADDASIKTLQKGCIKLYIVWKNDEISDIQMKLINRM